MEPTDRDADSPADDRWMTLAELAAARRISKASAARLVRRRKWRRQADNEGRVRVLVPSVAMSEADDRPDIRAGEITVISALTEAVMTLREQLTAAHGRAERLEAERDGERRRADGLAAQLAGEKARIELLQTGFDQASAEAQAARGSAEAGRRADEARRAMGVLARLRAALRGE
jgi:hypothetical protein